MILTYLQKVTVCLGNGCFISGTLVTTDKGLKPIEEIKIGEYVLSRNEESGETSYKNVTDILIRSTYNICTIELENGRIKSTTGHLFENLVGDLVQDGKLIMKQKSFYHVEELPKFAKDKVIKEAMRQI